MNTRFSLAAALLAVALLAAACQNPVLGSTAGDGLAADSRAVTVWHLEDYMKNATSLSAITGVYWSARDMDSSPVGNHHFITLVYESAAQCSSICGTYGIGYKSYANQKGLTVYYSTIGGFTDDGTLSGDIMEVFNEGSDCSAVKEQVNPKKYIYWYKPDYDYEAHRVLPSLALPAYGSTDAWIRAVIQKAQNFNAHYAAGLTVTYVLDDSNCACMVNSLFNALGVSAANRETLGEMSGVDWGEEDLIPASWFDTDLGS